MNPVISNSNNKKNTAPTFYFQAEHVWVRVKDSRATDDGTITRGCAVVRKDRNKGILVRDLDGKEFWVEHAYVLGAMHNGSLAPIEDMAELDDLQEYSVLHNLHLRYSRRMIYVGVN